MLRVAVQRAGRWRVVESTADPTWVGSDPDCAVRLDAPRVMGRHLALHERRGRVVARVPAWARVAIDDAPVDAPLVVDANSTLRVGDHRLQASVVPRRPSWRGRPTPVGDVGDELGGFEAGVRRFLTADEGWELTVPDRLGPSEWLLRCRRGCPDGRVIDDRIFACPRPPGRSAAELAYGVEQGWLRPPAEAIVAIAARALEALPAWRPAHGGIWPDRIWLTRAGEVWLLPPGPEPSSRQPWTDPFLSSDRRMGGPPGPESDRFALASVVRRLGGPELAWVSDALDSVFCLLSAARRANLDPAAHHVARVVGVLDAALGDEA